METLKRWLPELLMIGLIALTIWVLDSRERTETVRAWIEALTAWLNRQR